MDVGNEVLNDGELKGMGSSASSLAFPGLLGAHTAAPATFS